MEVEQKNMYLIGKILVAKSLRGKDRVKQESRRKTKGSDGVG